ncbi:fimbrial biogenesis chaperone [Arsenophonus endosymbiont of Apis mellifera]|uniref:fimbrial biogenesis chaperone n=1 Tax=Arsenophonus endosymbiont of Apis mellifera TaxID=1541805 RepID=UPI001F2D3390|nr:molecular chaperone [Arsenophonus endosymbiont of Apis mellifera]
MTNVRVIIMRSRIIKFSILYILLFFIFEAYANVTINGTRVIYEGNKREASILVTNHDENRPYLIQSFISVDANGKKAPFVVTPPLFRLDAGKENILRIMRTGGDLPLDRESIFYLNVKAIPSAQDNMQNTLFITVKTRIKLFYRPEKIQGDAEESYKLLTFRRLGKLLEVKNPSNYYVTINQLKIGNQIVNLNDTDMIAPQEIAYFNISANSSNLISWNSINSYGGISAEMKKNLP